MGVVIMNLFLAIGRSEGSVHFRWYTVKSFMPRTSNHFIDNVISGNEAYNAQHSYNSRAIVLNTQGSSVCIDSAPVRHMNKCGRITRPYL